MKIDGPDSIARLGGRLALMAQLRSSSTPHMAGVAFLRNGVLHLLSKCGILGNSGCGNSCVISVMGSLSSCFSEKETGNSRVHDRMKFRAPARQEGFGLSPGIERSTANSVVKGRADCGGRRVSDVFGLRPRIAQRVRSFVVNGMDVEERDTKSEAAGEEPDKSLKVVDYLNSLRNFEKEGVPKGAGTESDAGFDLQRMSRLLLRLDNPLSKYPVVHVAGTKGKGSTVSFLSQILRAAGFRVGSYTSPHVHSLRERIVSGTTGQPISTKAFNQLFDDVHETVHEAVVAEAGTLTHFEVLTALAFVHFAREKVDVAVIEAGLGGARDATNVIQASSLLAAVIVGIGEEHLEALGGSLESIALAKAGIIKDGRPVIIGRQTEFIAESLVRQVAALKKSVVLPGPGQNAVYNVKGISAESFNPDQICDISIHQPASDDSAGAKDEVWEIRDLKIPALGAHQLDNVATAIQTALCLRREGWKISDSAMRLGVESTTLPGRFQFVFPVEALKLGSQGSTVILDGAHTSGSGAALARTLREVFPNDCVAMVVAMAVDKDHHGFARALLEGTQSKIFVTTSVDIAGSFKRSTSSRFLLDSFVRASEDLNLIVLNGQESDSEIRPAIEMLSASASKCIADSAGITSSRRREQMVLVEEAESIQLAIAKAAQLILEFNGKRPGVICVTGSLHAVSSTLSLLSTLKNSSRTINI